MIDRNMKNRYFYRESDKNIMSKLLSITVEKQNLDELGKIILRHRKKGNFSRSELADMAGVGQTVIYEIEKGKITVRSDILFKILYALNIRVLLQSPFTDEHKEERDEKS